MTEYGKLDLEIGTATSLISIPNQSIFLGKVYGLLITHQSHLDMLSMLRVLILRVGTSISTEPK